MQAVHSTAYSNALVPVGIPVGPEYVADHGNLVVVPIIPRRVVSEYNRESEFPWCHPCCRDPIEEINRCLDQTNRPGHIERLLYAVLGGDSMNLETIRRVNTPRIAVPCTAPGSFGESLDHARPISPPWIRTPSEVSS